MINRKIFYLLYCCITVIALFPFVAKAQVDQSGFFVSLGGGPVLAYSKRDSSVGVQQAASYGVGSFSLLSTNIASSQQISTAMRASLGFHQYSSSNWYYGMAVDYVVLTPGSVIRHHSSDVEENNSNFILYTDQLKLHDQFGLSLLGGHRWHRLTTYARLAYINTSIVYENQYNFQSSLNPLTDPSSYATDSASHRISGGLVGLGLIFPVSKHFSASFEYQLALYPSVKLEHMSISREIEGHENGYFIYQADVRIKQLYTSSALLSLIYTF